jgi:competence protein ComEA
MNEWINRNGGYLIVLVLSVALNGVLTFALQRTPSSDIVITPPTAIPVRDTVRVFVDGAVVSPDVYELPCGQLVKDAIEAAGGYRDDAHVGQLNLARELKDQEHLFVPMRTQTTIVDAEAADVQNSIVNINVATEQQLESLPGIGPALAGRIVEHRNQLGSFKTVDQLRDVRGIGDVLIERVRDLVAVD